MTQQPTENGGTNQIEHRKSPDIINVEGLNELPVGCCVISGDENARGTLAVGQVLVDIIREMGDRIPPTLREQMNDEAHYPKYFIGPVLSRSYWRPYNVISQKLLERLPNLCWFRGTAYYENASGIPFPSYYNTFSANGYLGDIEALSYAAKNYIGEKNENPVLYMATLRSILEGAQIGAIRLGSEHRYDVCIGMGDGEGDYSYDTWALDNWKICDLGGGPNDIAKAKEILASKAVVIPRTH